MMSHAISDYFHFDHMFFHTLKPLLFKPGYLTTEYMAGRRVQYLHPVKMYIFISVVYFLLLFQTGHQGVTVRVRRPMTPAVQKELDSLNRKLDHNKNLSERQKEEMRRTVLYSDDGGSSGLFTFESDTTLSQYKADQTKLAPQNRDGYFLRKAAEKLLTYNDSYGKRAKEVFIEEFRHSIPKMMFVLLPLFALILRVVFSKSGKFYVEHLIYSFHMHCFFFLFSSIIILIEMALPTKWGVADWLSFLAFFYVVWYFYRSLRVVYHRNKFRTITKMIGMSFVYGVAISVCFLLLLLITVIV